MLQAKHARHYRDLLENHVLSAWFPRCIDHEHGGFLTNFDHAWRPRDPQDKLLEFQARQTLLAADLLCAYPNRPDLQSAVDIGFAFLSDAMWDTRDGGWFTQVDRAGAPMMQGAKHLHGIAYAIEACAAVHVATRSAKALDLAMRGFEWMDRRAHDDEHGGYRALEQPKLHGDHDHIGTPTGRKDMNVHSDLLESFTVAYRASNDTRMGIRLGELVELILGKYVGADLPYFFWHADWSPATNYVRFGTALQTASRLLEAGQLLGNSRELEKAATHLASLCFSRGWDHRRGGMAYGCTFHPEPARSHEEPEKQWWVQIEALKAAALCERLELQVDNRVSSDAIFAYFERNFLDHSKGGTFPRARHEFSLPHRLLRRRSYLDGCYKADIWKDGSHEGRAMLALLDDADPRS